MQATGLSAGKPKAPGGAHSSLHLGGPSFSLSLFTSIVGMRFPGKRRLAAAPASLRGVMGNPLLRRSSRRPGQDRRPDLGKPCFASPTLRCNAPTFPEPTNEPQSALLDAACSYAVHVPPVQVVGGGPHRARHA
jgi:hypothetical protein